MFDRYIEWLIFEHRQDDALSTLDEGIKEHNNSYESMSIWGKKKLEI